MQSVIKNPKIKRIIAIVFGTFIMAISISYLYAPAKIVAGGFVGIATILYHKFDISMGLTLAVINTTLFILCGLILGKDALKGSLLGAFLLVIFVQIGQVTYPLIAPYIADVTSNLFLVSLFGGLIEGTGLGIIFASQSNTGGSDLLARIIQYKFKHIKIGKLLLMIDAIIITSSFLVFRNAVLVLHGILLLLTSTFTIDFLIRQLNISKLAFVVSDYGDKVSAKLMSDFSRGVTLLDGEGAYTHKPKRVLICALKNKEMDRFQRTVLEIDKDAFIIFSESQQVIGNGFRYYK